MSSVGRRLRLRLFLEGIEVPVVGAQIQIGAGSPAAASIQVVPTDRGMELKPRTMVHLFHYDYEPVVTENQQVAAEDGSSLREEPLLSNPQYRLVYVGEIISFQFSKGPASRALILQCLDQSSYWDTTYQFMLSFGPSGTGIVGDSSHFLGAGTGIFNDLPGNDPANVVADLLDQSPKSSGLSNAQGLLAGILRVLESVGGVRDREWGVNDYLSFAELRARVLYQIGAEEGDDTSTKLLNRTVFSQFLHNTLATQGGLVSMRDVINLINGFIMFDVCPNPAPRFTLGTAVYRGTQFRAPIEGAPLSSVFQRDRVHPTTGQVRDHKGTDYTASVGTPVLPIALGTITFAGDSNGDGGVMVFVDHGNGWQSRYMHLRPELPVQVGDPAEPTQPIGFVGTTGRVSGPHLHLEVLKDGEYQDPEAVLSGNMVDQEEGVVGDSGDMTDNEKRKEGRLLTQIFRPHAWFVAPPRCNVIFPEHYHSLSYERNMMREVTRLQLRVNPEALNIGPDRLTDSIFYAPVIDEYRDVLTQDGELPYSLVLPHERFTGIIPRMERMGDLKFYVGPDSAIDTSGSEPPEWETFARQTAHFSLFQQRFAARSASISGYFNPYIVLGFPALVMTRGYRPVPGQSVGDLLEKVNAGEFGADSLGTRQTFPLQILGMVSSISHSLDQRGGGTTNVTLTHARHHRTMEGTDDEFLNIVNTEETEDPETHPVSTYLRAEESIGGSSVVSNPDAVRFLAQATPQGDDPTLSRSGGGSLRVGDKGPKGGIITRIETSGTLYPNPPPGASVGFNDPMNLYTEARIIEDVKITAAEKELLAEIREATPVENLLFPSWFSRDYSNERIGEHIYQGFYGTGSIVDEQVFQRSSSGRTPSNLSADGANPNAGEVTLGALEGFVTLGQSQQGPTEAEPPTTGQGISSGEATQREEIVSGRLISISQAVDALSIVYGALKASSSLGAARFAQRYTFRPIATMEEVFGSSDLQYNEDGTVASGLEGFHSASIADLSGLAGLVSNPDAELPRINDPSTNTPLDKRMDTRQERRNAVRRYVRELRRPGGRGQQG